MMGHRRYGGNGGGDLYVPTPVLDFDAFKTTSYPGTGSTWTSIGYSAQTLTKLDGDPTFNAGGWFDFDGNDSFSAATVLAAIPGSNLRTMSILYYIPAATGSFMIAAGYGANASTQRLDIGCFDTSGKAGFGGFGFSRVNNTAAIGSWVYQQVVFHGTSTATSLCDLYQNNVAPGVVINSGVDFGLESAQNFFVVGRIAGGATNFFTGRVMRVALWGNVLSTTELSNDYQNMARRGLGI